VAGTAPDLQLERPPQSDAAEGVTQSLRAITEERQAVAAEARAAGGRAAPPEQTGDGVLFPAVVLGVGSLGVSVLLRLRRSLHDRVGPADTLPHLRLAAIDTDPEVLRQVSTPAGRNRGPCLTPAEVILTPLNRPSYYLKPRDGRVPLDTWLQPKMLYRIPRTQVTTGVRALGRLAFCDNFRSIQRRLLGELEAATDPAALAAAVKATGLGLRSNRPRVYLLAGLAGGTGGGVFLDLAYLVRHLLRQLGYDQPDLVGLFLVPGVPRDKRGGRGDDRPANGRDPRAGARMLALANTCAALTELGHFASPSEIFWGRYIDNERPIRDPDPPFNRVLVLPLPEEADHRGTGDTCELAGEFLYRDLCTPLGRAADLGRAGVSAPGWNLRGLHYHTFGLYRLSFPRGQLIQQAARHLCRQMVERWASKDGKPLRESIAAWLEEQAIWQEASPTRFLTGLQGAAGRALPARKDDRRSRQPAACSDLVGWALDQVSLPVLSEEESPGPEFARAVRQALQQLEEVIGVPGGDAVNHRSSLLEDALRDAADALVNDWGQRSTELVVQVIEEPEFRLAGAEEAIRQLVTGMERTLNRYEPESKALAERAGETFSRLHHVLGTGGRGQAAVWAQGGRKAQALAAEALELVQEYVQARVESLLLAQLVRSYVSLRGNLSDELREVNFCRGRLTDLQKQFTDGDDGRKKDEGGRPPPASFAGHPSDGPGKLLLPAGCRTLAEAVEQFLEGVTPEDVRELDHQIQETTRQQFSALVHVCLTSANLVKELQAAMQQTAEQFVGARLADANVVELFLDMFPEEEALAEITTAFDEAAPERPGSKLSSPTEVAVLAAPDGPAGDHFRDLVRQALPDVEFTFPTSGGPADDIVFYRELPHLPLAGLDQLGSAGAEAYRSALAVEHFTPHSRIDVQHWLPLAGERVKVES
jgi:hypothetical protein